MSKVQVLIDLGTIELGESADLSPEGVLKAIGEIDSMREANSQLAQQNSALKNQIIELANSIEVVLNSDTDVMSKFSGLRQIVREAKVFAQ